MTVQLFTPFDLAGLELANRVVVAPMCQYAAEDGNAGDWHLMNLGQYCMGAAGLVFTEATGVSPEARITGHCLGLYSDDNEAALKRVVEFCRQYGVSAIGIQLAHAGRKASTHRPLDGGKCYGPGEGAWTTLAPSALPYGEGWHVPEELDAGGMDMIKKQFATATERSLRLGFDTIQVHAAHGYLCHQFLSPISNQRQDNYGGSLENRMRFPLEVYEAVRAVWPSGKPLGIRVSATDWIDGGWDIEQTVTFLKEVKALGCDHVDVSSGGNDPRQQIPLGPGYQVHFAERVKRDVGMATMAVGMIREPQLAEEIIASGKADFISLARGMMYDPRWAWHAAEELGADTPYADQYKRCNPGSWPLAFAERRQAAE